MGRTSAHSGRTIRIIFILAMGLVALTAWAPAVSAAPQDDDAKANADAAEAAPAAAPAPEVAPAPDADTSWDPWGCNPCPPCGCDKYPCCDCRKPKDPKCPTKYHNLRFKENWRACLCKPRCDIPDWSDRLKAMNGPGRLWVDVGGQIRFRWESWHNQGFGAAGAASNDAWMLGRLRAHADVHWGEHVRVFVEGIWADQWETRELGLRPIDRNDGDFLNFFGEVMTGIGGNSDIGAWAGRRELQTGQQRLVSPLDWANTRRTFQGAGAWWKKGFHEIDAWWTHPVRIAAEGADDWNEDSTFSGINYRNAVMNCRTWEAYFYHLDNDAVPGAIEQSRFTVGGLIDGKIPNTRFDYGAEAAYQFGTLANADISAYMASVTFGWKPCTRHWDPRIGIGLDYASGDSNPGDGTAGTFNQLFPLAHKYLGHADVLARQNLVAARLEASVKPAKKLTLLAWYHGFWRADSADAAYFVTGSVLRPPSGSTETALGTELDLMAAYKIDRHWKAFIEYAHFFTGEFFTTTGAGKDISVFYMSIQGTF